MEVFASGGYGRALVVGVSRRWRHGVRSRVAGARRRPQRRDGGSTRGTRGGGQPGAVGVRATSGRSAACAIAAARLTCVSRPRAGNKRRKPRVPICRPILLSAAVSPLVARRDSKWARALDDRRCCTLNRSLVISSFVFRPPPKLADPLPDPHENELSEDDRPAQERLEPALIRSAHRNNPL